MIDNDLRGFADKAATEALLATAKAAVRHEVARLASEIPSIPLRAILESVHAADSRLWAAQLAARCGCSRRTLSRRLLEARLPSPAGLIAWGRALVAAQIMYERGVTLEDAAFALDLSSSAALVHLFRRHIGPSPGEVRDAGGVRFLLGLLRVKRLDFAPPGRSQVRRERHR